MVSPDDEQLRFAFPRGGEGSASDRRVRRAMQLASVTPRAATRQKTLGAFYTPLPMAHKMVEWAVRSPGDRALDPSFGGLVFLHAAHARLMQLGAAAREASGQLHGCDLDGDAHASAVAQEGLGLPETALLHRDFFTASPGADLLGSTRWWAIPRTSATSSITAVARADGGSPRRLAST